MSQGGLLILDKPEGMTSADVVRVVKRRVGDKTGHLGTLDPFASGVLPVCVGEGTKIAQFLNNADKEYCGVIRLGTATDTADPTGSVTATASVPEVTAAQLAAAERDFQGERWQTPPMYSAVKQRGMPLYKLARQGIAVERQPRRVSISSLRLTPAGHGALGFTVSCSKGTYVRVLAEEIAAVVGSVGHLEVLRRTRFGRFRVDEAMTLAALEQGEAVIIGLRESLEHLREIHVDAPAAQRARQGYEPLLGSIAAEEHERALKLVGPDGRLAAIIVTDRPGHWRFGRVFPAA